MKSARWSLLIAVGSLASLLSCSSPGGSSIGKLRGPPPHTYFGDITFHEGELTVKVKVSQPKTNSFRSKVKMEGGTFLQSEIVAACDGHDDVGGQFFLTKEPPSDGFEPYTFVLTNLPSNPQGLVVRIEAHLLYLFHASAEVAAATKDVEFEVVNGVIQIKK